MEAPSVNAPLSIPLQSIAGPSTPNPLDKARGSFRGQSGLDRHASRRLQKSKSGPAPLAPNRLTRRPTAPAESPNAWFELGQRGIPSLLTRKVIRISYVRLFTINISYVYRIAKGELG